MAKKNKQPETELSAYEKAGMYTILKEEETETHKITTLRTYGGATCVCRIPKLPPDEAKIRDGNIIRALAKFQFPDMDLSKVKRIRLIK